MQIDIHMVENYVYVHIGIGFMQFNKPNNILMMELLEEKYLSISTLCISGITKCIKIFLQSQYLSSYSILNLINVSVGTAADFLQNFILSKDVMFYLITHFVIFVLYLFINQFYTNISYHIINI